MTPPLVLMTYEAEHAYAHEVGATHADGDTEERVQVTGPEPDVGAGGEAVVETQA